jgi:hypothetical protein
LYFDIVRPFPDGKEKERNYSSIDQILSRYLQWQILGSSKKLFPKKKNAKIYMVQQHKSSLSFLNKTNYSSVFSVYCADFKTVIFEKVHWALFEVIEVVRPKFHWMK